MSARRSTRDTAVFVAVAVGVGCFLGPANLAMAYSYGPESQAEWLGWPDYCKAGYLASDWSVGSPFKGRMPEAQIRQIRASHDTLVGIPGPHHFCMAMLYVGRAKGMNQKGKYTDTLKMAVGDFEYSYSRMRTSAPMYSLVAAYYGMALNGLGKRNEAIQMWNRGINTQPRARESYLAMAESLLAEKRPKEALDVLLRYEALKEYDTPDAEYFLGHTYFELKQYDKAREHADKAYRLGYPFPGLRNKLERVGR